MRDAPEILLVDDDPTAIQVMGRALAGLGRLRFAMNGRKALEIAVENPPDLILLDAEMPELDGFGVLRSLRGDPLLTGTPVIFVSGHNDEATETRALELGALDFVTKPIHPGLMATRVRNLLELGATRKSLAALRGTDTLTGLAGATLFRDTLRREESRTLRLARPLSLLLVEIAGFSGHAGTDAGDLYLQLLAAALQQCVHRPSDLIARVDQARFAVLLPDTPRDGALHLAGQIHQATARTAPAIAASATLELAIGLSGRDEACADWHGVPLDDSLLLTAAGLALQQAATMTGEKTVWVAADCA